MKRNIFLIFICLILFSCEENSITKEEEIQEIEKLYKQIEELSKSEICSDSTEWLITPIGVKACGGPTHYIPYPVNSDTSLFLELIDKYNTKQSEFNKKYRIYSDCSVPTKPSGIICIEEKPEFLYE